MFVRENSQSGVAHVPTLNREPSRPSFSLLPVYLTSPGYFAALHPRFSVDYTTLDNPRQSNSPFSPLGTYATYHADF